MVKNKMELDQKYFCDQGCSMHEANLVFNVGMELVSNCVPFELEWTSPVGRHDIAIKSDGILYGIIEAKQKEKEDNFQIKRYRSIGVPVLVVHWGTDPRDAAAIAKEWLDGDGIKIENIASVQGLIKKRRKPRIKKMIWDEDLNIRY